LVYDPKHVMWWLSSLKKIILPPFLYISHIYGFYMEIKEHILEKNYTRFERDYH
jgi:hypothetical protein